jgi:hypothetical protein
MVDALRDAVAVYHDTTGSTFGELGVRQYPWGAMGTAVDVLASLLPPRPNGVADLRSAESPGATASTPRAARRAAMPGVCPEAD